MRKFLILLIIPFLLLGCSITKQPKSKEFYNNVGPFLHYYEAIQSRLYNDIDRSITNLEIAKEADPLNDAIFYELAITYNTVGKKDTALYYLEKAVELNPKNKHYLNLLSILYINNQNFSKALDNQKQLILIDSTNVNYQFQLALLHSEQKNYEKAIALLNDLQQQVGFSTRLSEARLRIFLESNQIQPAFKEVNNMLAIDSTNPLFLIYQSEIHFKIGEDELGFNDIKKAIKYNPDFPQPKIELYQRYLDIASYHDGLVVLDSIYNHTNISATEKVRLFYPLLFEQVVYTNHNQKLDSLVTKLLHNHPDEIVIHELAYEHFLRIRALQKAREQLQILTLLDDKNFERWEKLISFDYSIGKKESVIYNSIKASKLFPKQSIFYVFQSLVLDELNDTDNAIFVLQEGIEHVEGEDKAELYGTLGDFYYKIGNNKEAFQSYDMSLDINPNNARVLNNYSYYLSVLGTNLSKALKMSTKAVQLEPNNSTYIDTKGWVLFKMERYEEARDVLRNAIAKDTTASAVINEHYGDALYKTGNIENAYIYWLKAKDLGGTSHKLEQKIKTRKYVP